MTSDGAVSCGLTTFDKCGHGQNPARHAKY